MVNQSINVRVDYPHIRNEDIKLIQETVAYQLISLFSEWKLRIGGFSQYDIKVDLEIRPVTGKSGVSVFVNQQKGV